MKNIPFSPQDYIATLPEDRKPSFIKLRTVIKQHLDKSFQETISYQTIGYVVPHNLYPAGYHCSPALPLPFINIANRKNFIAFYHMGIYADNQLLSWFKEEFPKHSKYKLAMGKSCIRFKKPEAIPYQLIGQLCEKMDSKQWIALYEKVFTKTR